MGIGNFLAELKRRHVYRVGGAYAVAAFGLIEIVSNVAPMFDLPGWIGRAVVFLLIVGFPVALLTAWMIEAKPAEGGEAPSSTRLDFVLAGALVLVIGLLVYQQFTPQKSGATVATAGEGITVAVLPFVNLSSDPEQEFFSDGMTEEITSALAKVKGLHVVGRTSAFEFKGQNKDLRAIGQTLGASHLLEGSVRKAGNRVRITGQLIKAEDGTHAWTENYDRELTDVFAVQDSIARAIAAALQAPLGLKPGETLVTNRAISPESYQSYLRAKSLESQAGPVNAAQAVALLDDAVARDPGYAPAWGLLAVVKIQQLQGSLGALSDSREFAPLVNSLIFQAETAANKALELDATNVLAQTALGLVLEHKGQWIQAEDAFQRALAADPDNTGALHSHSLLLNRTGRLIQALPLRERLTTLDPLANNYNMSTANLLAASGNAEAVIRMLATRPAMMAIAGPAARLYAAAGRYGDSADMVLKARSTYSAESVETAVRLLRAAPTQVPSPKDVEGLGYLNFVYLYVGAGERILEPLEALLAAGFAPIMVGSDNVWFPAATPVRKTERFKALARKAGWVDYWRARGWADMCRPVGADDFECS